MHCLDVNGRVFQHLVVMGQKNWIQAIYISYIYTGVSGFLKFFYLFIFYNEVRFVFCLSVKYFINTENCVTQNDLLFAHRAYLLPSIPSSKTL